MTVFAIIYSKRINLRIRSEQDLLSIWQGVSLRHFDPPRIRDWRGCCCTFAANRETGGLLTTDHDGTTGSACRMQSGARQTQGARE